MANAFMIELTKLLDDELFGNVNGVIVDNAYDEWLKSYYIKLINNEKINYVKSHDNDLSFLEYFPNIEFLTIPGESENIESIYNLTKLKGIRFDSNLLPKINLERFKDLEYLSIRGDISVTDLGYAAYKIKHLYCDQWNMFDLVGFEKFANIETLYLNFCKKLQNLDGVDKLSKVKKVDISYCQKLNDVSALKEINNTLEFLKIEDCNKIQNKEFLIELHNLVSLTWVNCETSVINKFYDLNFIHYMEKLKTYICDFVIFDGNLSPLLRLEHADVVRDKNNYSLRDWELPKTFVILKMSEHKYQNTPLKDVEGGKTNPNIMWNKI